MKKTFKYLLVIVVLINILIVLSGKTWMYKAITITYLKGYTSSYIDDFVYFPANIIKDASHQEWLVSKNYNKKKLPEFINTLNKELETVAFMVIQNDSIQYEKYWNGYSADSMSNSFSMSKSWVSTLIGVAIKDKKIKSVDQKACDFLPEFCVGGNSEITIKCLLTMSSGLNWEEDYHNPIGQTAQAYYGDKLRKLIVNLKSVETPGKVFKYHSSCTQLLTFIVERATNKTISEYASKKLWQPMGAKHPALWSIDAKGGDEKGFCCINSNARDFARLGKLYLHQGNWNGLQILDSSYVKAATSAADLIDENGNKNVNYGYQFWMTNYKNLHIYYARGLWGQYVICVPEKNMIIVRLGRKYGNFLKDGHHDDFYSFVDAALEMYR
ncbi:MAG: serine hydrolase [Bacteroidota bacterium]|nr:serine hydrolase [Bacteroidota bacterium]